MRKYAKTLMKTRGFRWFLRLSIPALILGIHWALGIPFGVSLLLVFGYVVAGTFLLCPPLFLLPFGLVLWPVLFPIFEFYGLRDGCQKKTRLGPCIRWLMVLVFGLVIGFLLLASCFLGRSFNDRLACFLSALLFVCLPVVVIFSEHDAAGAEAETKLAEEKAESDLSEFIGLKAVVVTPLRPVGRVRLDGTVYDAVAEGEFVDKDSMVRVVGFSVGQLKVRLVDGVNEQDADAMTNRRGVIICVICIGLAVCFCGCAGSLVDLTKTGQVTVETVSGEKTKILWAKVYQDGDDTLIKVALRRRLPTAYPLKTHVDIVVIGPDGEKFLETRTENIYVPRNVPGKGPNVKFFRKRIPQTLPQNSTVRIECR